MNVHINRLRIHLEIDEITWFLISRNQWLKSLHDRPVEIRVTDETVVDEKKLTGPPLFGKLWARYITIDLSQCGLFIDLNQLLVDPLTFQLHDSLPQVCFRQMERLYLILHQGEFNVRVHQHDPFDLGEDIASLRFIRLQKLPSCRYVEKDILHGDGGTGSTGEKLLLFQPGTADEQSAA